jgi:Tfp pilus assembly protein PilF
LEAGVVVDLLQVKNNIDISGEFLKKSKELLGQKKYNEARIWLEEFDKIHLDSDEKKWKYFNNLGVAQLGIGNDKEAANYLIEALKYNPENQNALENAAFGHHIKNDNKKVRELAEKLIKIDRLSPIANQLMIISYDTLEEALKYFQTIPSEIRHKDRVASAIAFKYYQDNDFENALKWYDVAIKERPHDNWLILRNLAVICHKTGQTDKAVEYFKKLRDQHGIDEKITPLEINVLEIKGDIQEAYDLSELYLKSFDNIHERIRNGMLLWRFNEDTKNDKLDRFILDFDIAELKSQPIELWKKLGFLFDKRSLFNNDVRLKYLDFTYEMRRNFYNDIEAHKLYYFNFITKFQDLIKKVEKIENNCHVQIEIDESGKYDFIIDDRPDVSLEKKEITTDDPRAQKVLGQKNGFKYTYKESPYGNIVAKITDFGSKYVFALGESEKIIDQAPDARGFYKIKIPENEKGELDVPAFFKLLENGSKGWKKISEETKTFYTSRRIPLSFYATAEKKNIIEAWAKVTKDKDLGVFSTTGIAKNIYPVLQELLLRTEEPIVIDLISVMTLVAIDDENIVSGNYGPFLIPQSSKDLLTNISSHFPNSQEVLDLANKIKNWIEKNCKIENPLTIKKELEEHLGKEFADPPSLSKEKGTFYYSDDTIQRSFSETSGIWTELLLMDLLYNGKIDSNKHKDMMIKLAEMYYYRTVVNSDILIHAIKNTNGKINSTIESLFHYFSPTIYDEDFSILTGTDFLVELFQQNFLSDYKIRTIISGFFNAFFENRIGRKMAINKLEVTIKHKFQYDPLKRDYLIGMLHDWVKTHIIV